MVLIIKWTHLKELLPENSGGWVAGVAGSPRLKNDLKSPDLALWSPEK